MTVVLLVDNQPLVGEAVRRMLAPYADIAYHYCSHPASAFDTTLEVKPTVVLLDMVMGDFDGLTLIKRFRNTLSTAELPLVVLSAREDARLKAEAFAAGANDYLMKFRIARSSWRESGTTQRASFTCSNATPRMPRSPRAGRCRVVRPFAFASSASRTDQDQLDTGLLPGPGWGFTRLSLAGR